MGATTKLLTDDEFLALPDEPGKQELLDGELVSMPPAKQKRNFVSMRVFDALRRGIHPSRVHHEAGYKLRSGRWLQPDVSVIWPDQPLGDWFERAPALAVEIASESNTERELRRKIAMYLEDGAASVWVIRPDEETLTTYSRENRNEVITTVAVEFRGTHEIALAPPEAVTIDIPKLIHGD